MSLRGYKRKWKSVPYLGPAATARIRHAEARVLAATAKLDLKALTPQKLARLVRRPSKPKKFLRDMKRAARKLGNRIRHATPQTASRRAKYNRRVKVWLTLPENELCRVWALSKNFKEEMRKKSFVIGLRATQCHHIYGRKLTRKGDLLLAEQWWCPVSAAGHEWVERNKPEAQELGLLAPTGKYNTWPDETKTE